nr:MAG TPA: hypothetical protein [Caudoviricetes sp.]
MRKNHNKYVIYAQIQLAGNLLNPFFGTKKRAA